MSAEIKAEIKNIRKIFTDEDYFYQIPEYQKPYSWDKDNVSELLDNLVKAFTNSKKNKDKNEPYFFGSLVLVQNGDRYDVIDGQQRLTTFTMLFCVLRNLYMDGFSDKAKALIGLSIQDKYEDKKKKIKFLTSESSQNDFLAVLEKVDFTDKPQNNDNNKYLQNAHHFKSFIDGMYSTGMTTQDLEHFITWIFENIAMATIICPNQDTAMQIFHSK